MKKLRKLRITADPKILGGKPVIEGTRISVELILDLLASGMSQDEIVKEYPFLTKEDIKEVLAFVSAKIKREEIHPILEKNGKIIFPTL